MGQNLSWYPPSRLQTYVIPTLYKNLKTQDLSSHMVFHLFEGDGRYTTSLNRPLFAAPLLSIPVLILYMFLKLRFTIDFQPEQDCFIGFSCMWS